MAERTPPRELSDAVIVQIRTLTDEGERLVTAGDHAGALPLYAAALRLVPAPIEDWEATTWIAAAMGDAHFFLEDFVAAQRCFALAVRAARGFGNPFVHLRLGQCALESGDDARAADELIRAYGLAGRDIFKREPPRYLEFLKSRAQGIE